MQRHAYKDVILLRAITSQIINLLYEGEGLDEWALHYES
jgi:hypothetical protein